MSAAISSLPASTSSKKSASTSKKQVSKAKSAKPKVTTSVTTRPSWKDIIKECIAANKEDARQGVSRSTIKRFAEETYKIDMSGLNLSHLNRAFTSGAENGVFVLPKGPSGKIKLAPRAKTSVSKENSKPPSRPTGPKKAATPAPKKVLASKAKEPTRAKKVTAPSKRGAAKKAVTGSKAAKKV